ncbi:hypothetical protein CCR75_006345 [Bremia lactucae]|uniref:Membrane insertase YidC/Oxa/ALB C-terminal domain-containing protein n=1 Tax=Bremia lactucae TaxID=4779 RepID=A0A976IM24_BRELC|nr:hypothetical protein CCR75_006345 [Bremia lactucae]
MLALILRCPHPSATAARCAARSGSRSALVKPSCFENVAPLFAVQTIALPTSTKRAFSSTPSLNLCGIVATSPSEKSMDVNSSWQVTNNAIDATSYSLSDLAIRSLDIVHSTTGLPWWATIVATTIVVRTAFFPLAVKTMRNAANMKRIQPEMDKLRELMNANPTRDPETTKEFQRKCTALMKKHDVRPLKSVLMPLAQIPVFLGYFWGLQNISKYFPEYAHEGVGWIPDLSAADPTMALPVISSALIVATVELGGEAMAGDMKNMMKIGMLCFALVMIPLTMNFQSGIFVYWVSSNTYTLVQTVALRSNVVKRALNIPVTDVYNLDAATTSPFELAVSRAKAGAIVKTHMYKPTKSCKTK